MDSGTHTNCEAIDYRSHTGPTATHYHMVLCSTPVNDTFLPVIFLRLPTSERHAIRQFSASSLLSTASIRPILFSISTTSNPSSSSLWYFSDKTVFFPLLYYLFFLFSLVCATFTLLFAKLLAELQQTVVQQ